jgi:predicted KAP-like P-loop ATPase
MRLAEEIRHNDQPISLPSEDLYGFDPFAKAIANGIRKMPAPNGYVLAINGPWGAGKSSVINLVLHHLADETAGGPIKVIRFTPWWFRGEEALALAFFRELQAALNPSLRKKARKLLPKIGARLLRGGGLVGSVLDVAAGGGGAVASNAMAYLESLIDTDDSLEALHDELRAALGKLQDRFLIVIDDIDRLTPEESLLIFKLVKSVGQLPNVLYLLAYDRALAEKLVAERFPSEGPHFLEKIVQAVFEVPEPGANALQAQVKAQIAEVCDVSFADAPVEFFNLLYDVVTPEIAKPRDVIRFTNTIVFSWPAVAGEVHAGDFLALEVLRLFDPGLYRSIRVNKPLVCGLPGYHQLLDEPHEAYERAFLRHCTDTRVARRKSILQRIFPPLESVWGNMHWGDESANEWARERRACSPKHFDTYFRFAVGSEVLPRKELDELISRAGERAFMERYLREALAQGRPDGTTKASLVLEELARHADNIPTGSIGELITAILCLGDELDVAADDAKAFQIGDNELRIHWLIRTLTLERFGHEERSSILLSAAHDAALSTLVHLADRVWRQHNPSKGDRPVEPEKQLMTFAEPADCRDLALAHLTSAAASGELIQNRRLLSLLYRWWDLADDKGNAAKMWATAQLDSDRSVAKFAAAFTKTIWSHSGDDMVSVMKTKVETKALDELIHAPRFRARCEEVVARSELPSNEVGVITAFLEAWRRTEAAS